MPNYKTHSIHGEIVLPNINNRVYIDNEAIKTYSMGPDVLISTDYKTFNTQHCRNTRDYFLLLIELIKTNKLYDNSEVMAYLYGQIDHYILDILLHPLIYYMSEDIDSNCKLGGHGLIENWIDDYIIDKYDKNDIFYYRKNSTNDKELNNIIDEVYNKIFNRKNESIKYNIGIFLTILYDSLARRNLIGIFPLINKIFNIGDIINNSNYDRVIPYLNLDNSIWTNPVSGEEYNYTFDDLWDKSIEEAINTIEDINNYFYNNKSINNKYILNNLSYNTGYPCCDKEKFVYVKKYK